MKHWAVVASAWLGAGLVLACPARAQEPTETPARPSKVVVDIKSNKIVLLDVAQVGQRLVAVGERGFTLVSDDGGKTWQGVQTPTTRTLTGLAFKDDKVGVAVGHGGSLVRTEDGGKTWQQVALDDAGSDSLLDVTWLGGDHFVAYGAFGLYFDSQDAGRTWTRVTVLAEDFEWHISQVIPIGGTSLLLVAEAGTLARSDDGGQTWTALTSPYSGSFFGALAVKDGSVLAYGMRGNVWRTTDQGATWQKVPLETTTSIMAGRQLEDGRVMLVGNAGLIATSADGGQSFELHRAPAGKGFAALAETASGIILAGEGGISTLDPAWLKAR